MLYAARLGLEYRTLRDTHGCRDQGADSCELMEFLGLLNRVEKNKQNEQNMSEHTRQLFSGGGTICLSNTNL